MAKAQDQVDPPVAFRMRTDDLDEGAEADDAAKSAADRRKRADRARDLKAVAGFEPAPTPKKKPGRKPKEKVRAGRITARAFPEFETLAQIMFDDFRGAAEVMEDVFLQYAENALQSGKINGRVMADETAGQLESAVAAAKAARE